MLTSKELLEKTGISRATLNNYIASGLVPRPDVLQPRPQDGDAPRIGYFPDSTVQRIAEIQRLKQDGWSMARIASHFAGTAPPSAGGAAAPAASPVTPPARAPAPGASPPVSTPGKTPAPGRTSEAAGPPPGARAALTDVAIVVAQLEDTARLWSILPPEEFFELARDVWAALDPVFRRHAGAQGPHPAEGMVCYFLPRADGNYLWNAVASAAEGREAMRRVSKQWQLRKRWTRELYVNCGIDEGREWHGPVRPGPDAQPIVVGDTVLHAAQMASLARGGSIWATRNVVAKLGRDERRRLRWGVRSTGEAGRGDLVPCVYARVQDIADLSPLTADNRAQVARLAVTEILEVATDAPGSGSSTGA